MTQPISPSVLARVLVPFAAGYFLSYLYRVVNAVIAPDLTSSVGIDAAALGLLTSAYFITFAAAQLPLGIMLDRYGPRRVEAVLLLFAAGGAVVFGLGETVPVLAVGRGLIGLGVSACLMAAFKANVQWFDRERLPLVNGIIFASGGLGALTATAPIEAALHLTDWRGVFMGLGALTFAAAGLIYLVVPDRKVALSGEGLRAQLIGTASIYTSRTFWLLAPAALLSQTATLSIQGLWSGPWMRDVAQLSRPEVAEHLFAGAAAMTVGFLSVGALAERLARVGIPPASVFVATNAMFLLTEVGLALGWTGAPMPLWMAFSFFSTGTSLSYAILTQAFPPHLAGRVNTALNLLTFVAAFAAQYGMGEVIALWPQDGRGAYPAIAYGAAFGGLLALQVVAFGIYLGLRGEAKPRIA